MQPDIEGARGVNGAGYLIGIDVGGTFTDVVLVDETGRSAVHKAFSVRGDEAQGIFDALTKAAAAEGHSLTELLTRTRRLVHGSTVAANALIEKKGARTAFVTTKGFRDTLVMRRMFRENMYDLRAPVPENILAREAIVEADERVDRSGTAVVTLADDEIQRITAEIRRLGVEAVGISLLFSFRNPEHEQRIRDAIRRELPDVYVATSSDIAPEIRDYERASTTLLCAYLGPRCAAYLLALERRLIDAGLTCPLQIMRSNGGVCSIADAVARPTDLLLSGPAGGVVGALSSGALHDEPNLISFDMGGTSCDISVVRDGLTTSSTFLPSHSRFEGWDVLTPFLDIHALGSGGGSIAWVDQANGLHVGPRSAGSTPGPACYGRGGQEPTVTDANLALGYLNPEYFLGSEVHLDRAAADQALAGVAAPLGLDVTALAAGIFEIINAAMAGRTNVILADKGGDPREFTLFCYGGAGAIHASAVMDELGLRRVIVPREAAAFSAAGLLRSDERYDFVHTVLRRLQDTDQQEVTQAFAAIRERARSLATVGAGDTAAGDEWIFEHEAEMRYSGQTHDIRVALPGEGLSLETIQQRFEQEYTEAYGYLSSAEMIQLVNLRVGAVHPALKPKEVPEALGADTAAPAPKAQREVFFPQAGGWQTTAIYDGLDFRPGMRCDGPAIAELPATTIVVRPGQRLSMNTQRDYEINPTEGS